MGRGGVLGCWKKRMLWGMIGEWLVVRRVGFVIGFLVGKGGEGRGMEVVDRGVEIVGELNVVRVVW